MAHKTDFKDALFEQRKYRMQSNPDGTVTPVDETEYSQEGDRVGAKYFNETGEALNDLENPIFEDYTSTVAPDPEIALGLIKSKASFKALFQNIKAALLGMVFKKNVLTSMEEVNANTDEGMVAGALSVKELSRDLGNVVFTTEGSGEEAKYFIQIGADTASKKELGNIVSASEIHASIGDISQGQTSFGKFSGFKTLNYSISSQASDRYIYLYVNETRIDTVAGTTKSGSYILEPDKEYFITLRSSWGMGSGLISLS